MTAWSKAELKTRHTLHVHSPTSSSLSHLGLTYYALICLTYSEISMFKSRLLYNNPFISSPLSNLCYILSSCHKGSAYLILGMLLQFLIWALIKPMKVTLFSDSYIFPINKNQRYQVLSTQSSPWCKLCIYLPSFSSHLANNYIAQTFFLWLQKF